GVTQGRHAVRRRATRSCYGGVLRRCVTPSNQLLLGELQLFCSMLLDRETLHTWVHHWQDEYDAAFLYLVLAGQEPEPKRKDVYIKLAGVEERHVQMWEKLLVEHGHPVGRPRPSVNARLRAWFGRRFGPSYLLPLLLREEGEEEEIALVYQTKGIEAGIARQMAAEVMRDSQRALDEQVREELKIGEAHATPFKEGWVTGASTAVGALIPVAPFLVLSGPAAAWTAFAIAMLSHFAVGAARSFFTGRGVIRSGIDMFVVGLGVAGVGYVVGDVIAEGL